MSDFKQVKKSAALNEGLTFARFIIILTCVDASVSFLPRCSINVLLLNGAVAVRVADLQTVAGHTEHFVNAQMSDYSGGYKLLSVTSYWM